MEIIEHSIFLIRNERGELVPKVPEILDYLRLKVKRTKEKFDADEFDTAFCLNYLAAEETMVWRAKHELERIRNT